MDAKKLQTNLGVVADGIIGGGTMTALFAACRAKPDMAAELGLSGAIHMKAAGILDSTLRLAHFLAQVSHESGGFRYMEEIWGPTDAQRAYEGREALGNVNPGDGSRFRGRGPIQITGRANYRFYGRTMGIDLERHPELAAIPSIGLWAACVFWTTRGLNDFADRDDIITITRRINGGQNGAAQRQALLTKMKALVG